MHVWPSTARPILSCIYICPTETYKDAQHACVDHVQSGRKHSCGIMSTCQTWVGKASPREQGQRDSLKPPPRETSNSMRTLACQTSSSNEPQHDKHITWCPGTKPAPSRRPDFTAMKKQHVWPAPSRVTHHLVAWDKRQRLGEATNPGPEPPREIWLRRKNGQRDPLRLCTQNGGWVWNMHYAPPLRVAKRPTPHEALRNWLTKHEPAIEPDSAEAARQLAKAWEEFPVPQPIRRTRSLPPREMRSITQETLTDPSPPRETPKSNSQPEPPVRKRLRGKTSKYSNAIKAQT